jgi:hypothetical protein
MPERIMKEMPKAIPDLPSIGGIDVSEHGALTMEAIVQVNAGVRFTHLLSTFEETIAYNESAQKSS